MCEVSKGGTEIEQYCEYKPSGETTIDPLELHVIYTLATPAYSATAE